MERTISLKPVDLPDGKYDALWSGYILHVQLPGWDQVEIRVNNGIRGIYFPRKVNVYNGWVYVDNVQSERSNLFNPE